MNVDAFSNALWMGGDPLDITIGGAGNLGSWLSLFLARQGHKLYVYDFDTIEDRNTGGQFYGPLQNGQLKTVALQANLVQFCGPVEFTSMGRFEADSMVSNVVFACFDSIDARRLMFEAWLKLQMEKKERIKGEVNLYVDARSTLEMGQLFCVNHPNQVEAYRKSLFPKEQAMEVPCNYKSTSHNGALSAALMVSLLNAQQVNRKEGMQIYSTPFSMAYELPQLSFKHHDTTQSITE